MAAAKKKRPGLLRAIVWTVLLAIPGLIAPPVIRGLAADKWLSHYGSMDTLPRPRRAAARAVVEKADLALWNLAPLPQSSAAALRALEIGQRTEYQDHDREAALVIYRGVRESCSRVRSRPFSGPGFAVIEARAAALEGSARAGAVR